MEENKKRPVRIGSYQGSYLEIPLADNDDDSYGGRVYMGIYPSLAAEKNAREKNKERENTHLPTSGQRSSCSKIATTTQFLTNEKCLNSPKLIVNDSFSFQTSLSTTRQMPSYFKKSDSLPPFGESQQPSTSKGHNLDNILNTLSLKRQRLRKLKPDDGSNSRQKQLDWHDRLKEMYGSVEKARNRPWMTTEEKEVLATMPENTKLTDKFSCQNWDFEVKKKDDALFQLPKDDGLDTEISKQLQFIRDSLSLYRTMNLPHGQSNSRRPLFLPFLRRNLRYNNFVPMAQKPLMLDFEKIQQTPKIIAESSENTESECSEQDLSIKLLSIKHNLLPVGYNASVTFFHTRYSYNTKKFLPISKIDSSTFIMEIAEEIQAVNIDLPPELDFDENDPSDIFILLRVVFFDPAKEIGVNQSRNLRNVPARLAGQCERAREAERHGKKHGQRMRESRDGDIAMFGAFQLTKKVDDGWSYCCGTTSLILIETEKLGINPNATLWQKDGSIVYRLIALGRKYHTNPFVYMEIVNGEDDDSVISLETRRLRKQKRKSNGSESSYVTACDELPASDEYEFNYSLPTMMIYQLSLDFMYQPDPLAPEKRIVTGFNTIVEENVPENIEKIHKERKAESEPKELLPMHKQALAIMDQQAPLPKMFSYHVTRAPGWCIFCEIHCKNLFALMWHLKTCHSRFEYVYRSAIEYKPGHFLPGFVMHKAPVDEDMYWHHRKSGICAKYNRLWPHKFKLEGSFITPCNFLFKNIVDTLQDIAPILSLKDEFNKWGPRPINYEYTVHGRLVKLLPGWMAEKMQRELNDIVDLDDLEIVFMLIWNDFLFHYGPIAGKETNVYRLCRLFIELRRQEITDYHLETVTLILVTYFVEQKILSTEELYDLIMRLNKNYDPFTDILHPLSVNEKLKTQAFMKKEAVKAERLKRKRPKKVYGKSSISLRRRCTEEALSTDASRCTSKESSFEIDDNGEDVFFDCESSGSPV